VLISPFVFRISVLVCSQLQMKFSRRECLLNRGQVSMCGLGVGSRQEDPREEIRSFEGDQANIHR